MIVTDTRCQKAIDYLVATDEEAAKLKTDMSAKEYALDVTKKRMFLEVEGSSVEARKASAEVSMDVQLAQEAHLKAMVAFETVKARRTTAALIVDTWRSVNANRRIGNV